MTSRRTIIWGDPLVMFFTRKSQPKTPAGTVTAKKRQVAMGCAVTAITPLSKVSGTGGLTTCLITRSAVAAG